MEILKANKKKKEIKASYELYKENNIAVHMLSSYQAVKIDAVVGKK